MAGDTSGLALILGRCGLGAGPDALHGIGDQHRVVRSVLIVDDNAAFRAVARAVLEAGGYQVVAEAESGNAALALASRFLPDVVLLDIGLPDLNGFSVCRALHAAAPATTVVLCSVRDGDQYGEEIARSAAAGFLPKSQLSVAALSRIVASL